MWIINFFKHFNTITKHRHQVIKHCFKAGIGFQGLFHDIAKYHPKEFFVGVKYFQGTRSPNEQERDIKGYSSAWMHHKGVSKHHFEYWTDYSPIERKIIPVQIPINYVKEMFCDRVAASKIYLKDKYNTSEPFNYWLLGKSHRFIHPETSRLIEQWLLMLRDRGEEETFTHIKQFANYINNDATE